MIQIDYNLWVNPDHVQAVVPHSGGSALYLQGRPTLLEVAKTPAEVLKLLPQLQPQLVRRGK